MRCAGQQPLAQRRLGGVQGQGQRGLDAALGQTLEDTRIAHGGKHQILVTDIALRAQEVDGLQHVVQVVSRFAHAHEDDLAHRAAAARQNHLGDDLGALDLTQQALATGHTEHAADCAADLGGHAQAVAREQHALHGLPVGEIDQQALGAILRGVHGAHARQGFEFLREFRQGLAQGLRHEILEPATAAILRLGLRPPTQHPFFVHGSRAQGAQSLSQGLNPHAASLTRSPGRIHQPARPCPWVRVCFEPSPWDG